MFKKKYTKMFSPFFSRGTELKSNNSKWNFGILGLQRDGEAGQTCSTPADWKWKPTDSRPTWAWPTKSRKTLVGLAPPNQGWETIIGFSKEGFAHWRSFVNRDESESIPTNFKTTPLPLEGEYALRSCHTMVRSTLHRKDDLSLFL